MWTTLLSVALGGAIGSAARFAAGLAILRMTAPGFPIAILSVNVVGSALMGLAVVWTHSRGLGHWQPFLMTGILGGFTTFSAFSLEAYTLFERGQTGAAAAYVGLSVVLSIAGLVLGIFVARGLWA